MHRIGLRLGAAIAVTVALGAAAPVEPSPVAPLAPSAYADEDAHIAKRLTPQTASLQAAPVPDQDVDAPLDVKKPEASVGPKFFSQKTIFQGDGYNYASSEQATLDGRRLGVPGLGLSVPVK